MPKTLFVSVFLDEGLSRPLDYSVPEEWQEKLEIGMRVEVPLRGKIVRGTVGKIQGESNWKGSVLPISKIVSHQGELSEGQWKLAEWMSSYYATPMQKVLRCFVPPYLRQETKEKTEIFLTLCQTSSEAIASCEQARRKTPEQAKVLETLLQSKRGIFLSDLLATLQISRSPIDSLIKKKWIAATPVVPGEELLLEEEFFPSKPKQLNEEQAQCFEEICRALAQGAYSTHLIHGITGSGKTEIYLQAIGRTLAMGKGAILLVPEISLTSQTIERFKSRFAEKIAILHHKRSFGERASAWQELREGKVKLVIGARSAIFCPIQNLGLIIVDEEHDGSYKQSGEMPCYHGRDVAVMRGFLERGIVLLGSATPSIESRYNAEVGKYRLHRLHTRASGAALPSFRVVDMKQALEKQGGFTHFSSELLEAIEKRLEKGEQTLLLLNRRGYNRMQVCAGCRSVAKCPHCDVAMAYHKKEELLKCHLCNSTDKAWKICPQCQTNSSLEFKGFGTQHVEKSLHAIFPSIRTLRMDRDTTQAKHSHETFFKQFRAHKADVLIGTQMIAKGFHFPSVTLVGILNLDSSLSIPDFRAPEQVFQLLIQVAGRSGRAELSGEVILQTFFPHHSVMKLAAKHDYETFYQTTIEERRMFHYPPFCHLVKVVFSSPKEELAKQKAERARLQWEKSFPSSCTLLPPVPAGHPKVHDLYRYQILIKTLKISELPRCLAESEGKIDVDAMSTFF